MKDAHEKGTPVLRTLFYEFPDDEKSWTIHDEYLYGPDILVAPVLNLGAKQREVYLPKGAKWTNLHTGEMVSGGTSFMANAPLHEIPVFLKNDSHQDWIGRCCL